MGTQAPLLYEDLLRVAQALASYPDVVLVGGQALNVWATRYEDRANELKNEGPFVSKDADFQGSRSAVEACAKTLGGRFQIATLDDSTPSFALVIFRDSLDQERQIDFLKSVGGVTKHGEVARTSIPIDLGAGITIKVLHPVLCLESRTYNVVDLASYYANERGLMQLRASVACAREFISDLAEVSARSALRLIERVFRLARSRRGLAAFTLHGVDVFAAVAPLASLPAKFRDLRYPRIQELLIAKRSKAHLLRVARTIHADERAARRA